MDAMDQGEDEGGGDILESIGVVLALLWLIYILPLLT